MAPNWAVPALISVTLLFLLGLFSTEISDPDFWWHLKTGAYIAAQHRLPNPDPFAYTTNSAPASPGERSMRAFNLTHEWLAQVVWYAIQRVGGWPAAVLWKAFLMAALCSLSGWIVRRRTGSWLWAVAAALATASLAVEFAHDRPAILTFVFTAGFIAIFEERRGLWWLPVLALIWANCHGGFFFAWILCAAYSADAVLRRASDTRRILLISGLSVLLTGLNPNGFAAVVNVIRYRQSPLQSTLVEWSRPDLWGYPYAFDLLLYGSALVLMISRKRVRPSDWILFVLFAAASLTAFRNELFIGMLAPILIASYWPWKRPLPWWAPVSAVALVAVAVVGGTVHGSLFQLRAAEWRFPEGAAQFLSEHHVSARVFNTYEYGGYLIWKGVPVFIDGRALSELVFDDYRKILGAQPNDPAPLQLLARYGAGAIVMNSFEYTSGALYPLALSLAQPDQREWKLVYEDPQSLVFLRAVPAGVGVLDRGRILSHLEAECTLHVERDPEFSLCARTLGDYFLRTRDRERARRILELYLAHPYGPDPEARRAYLQLLEP
jgi:hypothetical protein